MRRAHGIGLFGAVLALFGALVLPWQRFEEAGITARGFDVAPAGQVLAGLALLLGAAFVAGLVGKKRLEWGRVTLLLSALGLGWIVVAHLTRASGFETMPGEEVSLLAGFYVAAFGFATAFAATLGVFAADPPLAPTAAARARQKQVRRRRVAFDERVGAALAISALLQIFFIGYAATEGWQETAERELQRAAERDLDIRVVVADERPSEPIFIEEGAVVEETTEGKAAGGETGKFGDPDEPKDKKSKVPPNEGKQVDEIESKKASLLDLLPTNKLNGPGGGAIAAILRADGNDPADKIAVAMNGTGSEFVVGNGNNGLDFEGIGRGGPGESPLGRLRAQGRIDTGPGIATRTGLAPKKKRRVGVVDIGTSQSRGFCKDSDIRSAVKRRAGAIRACYERRLMVSKDLSGKLNARWTIGLDGRVSGVSASGSLSDSSVRSCVMRVLRRIHFARPEGGICVVQWPFVFSPR